MHPNVLNKVLMELARGCPSSAWNVMVLGVHPSSGPAADPMRRRAVGRGQHPPGLLLLCALRHRHRVEGGYVLNGEWLTSSGCDHAAGGAFLGGRVEENGEQVFRSFWVQRSDFDIIDDWYVVGLAGTGSKTLSIREVFVPNYRSHVIGAYDQESHGE
jgi:3-hydroxy-9,10-secoandrosta-1,3,5(10)-triene-9,17-dione monooxygenase